MFTAEKKRAVKKLIRDNDKFSMVISLGYGETPGVPHKGKNYLEVIDVADTEEVPDWFEEGVGMCLITIMGPSLIARWFPENRRAVPMGIWSTWVTMGQSLVLFLGSNIAGKFGWKALWLVSLALMLVGLVGYVVFLRRPGEDAASEAVSSDEVRQSADSTTGPAQNEQASAQGLAYVLKSRPVWLYAGIFFSVNIVFFGFANWAAICWESRFALPTAVGNTMIGIMYAVEVPLSMLLSRGLSRVNFLKLSPYVYGAYVPIAAAAFLVPNRAGLILFMVLYGVAEGLVLIVMWGEVTQAVGDTKLIPLSLGVTSMFQQAGVLSAAPITGAVMERFGYVAGAILVGGAAAMCLVFFLLYRKVRY